MNNNTHQLLSKVSLNNRAYSPVNQSGMSENEKRKLLTQAGIDTLNAILEKVTHDAYNSNNDKYHENFKQLFQKEYESVIGLNKLPYSAYRYILSEKNDYPNGDKTLASLYRIIARSHIRDEDANKLCDEADTKNPLGLLAQARGRRCHRTSNHNMSSHTNPSITMHNYLQSRINHIKKNRKHRQSLRHYMQEYKNKPISLGAGRKYSLRKRKTHNKMCKRFDSLRSKNKHHVRSLSH
jgi:hypothetical protein